MNSAFTQPIIVGGSAVGATAVARALRGSQTEFSSGAMAQVAGVGAVSAYLAPAVNSATIGSRLPICTCITEALVSGGLAGAGLWALGADSNVAMMHIPVQAVAHYVGKMIARRVQAQASLVGDVPPSEDVGDIASAVGV